MSPETRVHAEHFAADSMSLPLLFLMQLHSNNLRKNSRCIFIQILVFWNRVPNGRSRSSKVVDFGTIYASY